MGKLTAKIVELPTEAHVYMGEWGESVLGSRDLGRMRTVSIPAGHTLSGTCPCNPTVWPDSAVAPKPLYEHADLRRQH